MGTNHYYLLAINKRKTFPVLLTWDTIDWFDQPRYSTFPKLEIPGYPNCTLIRFAK